MAISAERFLARVASRGLLSKPVLIALRKQLAESGGEFTAQSLAQLLLKNGHLTAFQAEEMLRDRREENEDNAPRFPAPSPIRIAELESSPPPAATTPPLMPTADGPTPGPPPTNRAAPITTESLQAADDAKSLEDLLSDEMLRTAGEDASVQRDLGQRRSIWHAFGRQPTVQGEPRSEWDSPLLLVGGGILVLLVLLGGTVYYLIERGGGDTLREAADAAYDSGAYAQAVEKYDQFLERFPRHASASQGRVRRGLAQLRLVLQTSRDGPHRLTTAQAILTDIDEEAAFSEARAELAALLPQIAEGLAKQAESSTDAKETRTYVGLTTDALSLVTNSNYVPKSLFP
ncbi:MAG: hypothetical protein ACC645_08690, partial [Pirellulales bacterium]